MNTLKKKPTATHKKTKKSKFLEDYLMKKTLFTGDNYSNVLMLMMELCSAKQSSQMGLKLLALHELYTVQYYTLYTRKRCYTYKNGPLKWMEVIALFRSRKRFIHQVKGKKHYDRVFWAPALLLLAEVRWLSHRNILRKM